MFFKVIKIYYPIYPKALKKMSVGLWLIDRYKQNNLEPIDVSFLSF